MDHAPIPMVEVEQSGHMVLYANSAFCHFLGKKLEELLGKPLSDFIPTGDESLAALDRVYRTGEAEVRTEPARPESDSPYWSYVMWPVLALDQTPSGVVVQVTETTIFHQQAVEMNQSMLLAALHQHEVTEAAERDKNVQLRLEVSERERVEVALRENRERLQAALDGSGAGTFRWNLQSNALDWDENLERLFSLLPGEEICSLENFIALVYSDDRQTLLAACEGCTRDGVDLDQEFRVVWPNGSLHWLNSKGKTHFDNTGRPVSMTGMCMDITERKRAEEAVRERTAQFETLLNTAPLGVYLVDDQFRICAVNPRAHPVFAGIAKPIGQDFNEVIHRLWPKAYADEIVHRFQDTLQSGEPYFVPERIERRIDLETTEYYEWQINRIPLPEGRHGVVCYFRDISHSVRAREELRGAAERLRFMAESMPQKIYTARPTGEVDYLNQQWTEFTGLPLEQIRDWGWLQFIHPDDVSENLRRWKHSIETGEFFELEHRFRRRDGTYRWHLSRAHAMRDAEGKILLWIGSDTDIEDQKRWGESLERAVAERTARLEESIAELEGFSYSIAHDMRAPLRSMQSFAKILAEECGEQVGPTGQDYIRRITTSASRLDHLIRDVLNYSQVVSADLILEPVDLEKLIQGIVESYPNLQPPHSEVTLKGRFTTVLGNQAALTQCFSNLLGNAVKFVAPDVNPQVCVWSEPRPGFLRVLIQDNGIGIPDHAHDRIFTIFQRLSRSYEGTGIGLAIVKKAIERMGGSVGFDSEPGKGTTFWLDLQAV